MPKPKPEIKNGKPYGLTNKQKKFADAYIETGNITEASSIAYYDGDAPNRKIAGNLGRANLQKPHIRKYILAHLNKEDAPGKVAKVLLDGMGANTVFKGEECNAPDHGIRLKAAQEVARILDIYPTNQRPTHQTLHLERNIFLEDVPEPVKRYILEHEGEFPDYETYEALLSE